MAAAEAQRRMVAAKAAASAGGGGVSYPPRAMLASDYNEAMTARGIGGLDKTNRVQMQNRALNAAAGRQIAKYQATAKHLPHVIEQRPPAALRFANALNAGKTVAATAGLALLSAGAAMTAMHAYNARSRTAENPEMLAATVEKVDNALDVLKAKQDAVTASGNLASSSARSVAAAAAKLKPVVIDFVKAHRRPLGVAAAGLLAGVAAIAGFRRARSQSPPRSRRSPARSPKRAAASPSRSSKSSPKRAAASPSKSKRSPPKKTMSPRATAASSNRAAARARSGRSPARAAAAAPWQRQARKRARSAA